ncbi:hypothetical protein AADG42_08125 [Ammonicoccus fulvus]|uniref:Uncharacterized protein n=1 Tax=Ammonicoccus fulvus TaxID=3138240 RepID=A0ABZ3FMG4_9ACTN
MTTPSTPRARSVVAPTAPGRMGVPLHPEQARRYLSELHTWVDERRRELDLLDAAVLRSPLKSQLTRDMMLSLALWKSVKDRLDLLMVTWDSGRVGLTERERLSALIWGRLDATLDPSLLVADKSSASPLTSGDAQGLSVSLPEACRLSDAMASQLRTRLALDPAADQITARLRDLRAQIERIRDQVALEPAGLRSGPQAKLDDLSARVAEMTGRVERGADIGGLIGPAEIEAARFERDLIVGGVERREARGLVEKAREMRDDLESRETAMHQLVAQCVRRVAPAPKYAVPDPEALGPVPNTRAQLEDYLDRLHRVGKAMQVVQDAYAKALAGHEDLITRLGSHRSRALAQGFGDDPDLTALDALTTDILTREPCPVPLATELVEAYEVFVQWIATQRKEQRP